MKNLLIVIFAILYSCNLSAGDILTLNNQMSFEGKLMKIKHCEVIFKAGSEKFSIPCTDIYSIQFENVTDKVYVDYLEIMDHEPDLCDKAISDAAMYHGNGFINFTFGFLFGPLAMIPTAFSKPDPGLGARTYRLSENRDHFYHPAYLKCYRRKVRSNNLAMQGIGWGSFILIALVVF